MADKVLGKRNRVAISNITIDSMNMSETINTVEMYIKEKEALHLMGVNADKINLAAKDKKLEEIINNCGIINADGASIVLASKFLNKKIYERVAGIDLMEELLRLSNKKKYSVYFLGAEETVVTKLVSIVKKDYPYIQISGYRNGYFTDGDYNEIKIDLKKEEPDIVFIGITSPKKEILVEKFQADGLHSVFMGVGGSFDVLAGKISRAPKWMQDNSLEWLYRVYKEPRRLFKRYFIGNLKFIMKVIKEKYERK